MAGFIELAQIEVPIPRFVTFWRGLYSLDDAKYTRNINAGGEVDTRNVVALMQWKAGPRHGARAERFGRAVPASVLNDSRTLPPLGDQDLYEQYRLISRHLKSAGLARTNPIIWPIFLCHIAQPSTTPIYDVNAWLAWRHIKGWISPLHYQQMPRKFVRYLEYRAWFNGIVSTHGIAPRELDQALVTFGRFLRSNWGRPLR
jgi:hypothetical protein